MLTLNQVLSLPDLPGVYFFKSQKGELLYVGKAKRLRRRVRRYMATHRLPRRIRELVRRTHTVEVRVLGSELEALVVESRLIKEFQPPYNVAQKRFCSGPFLKVVRTERFPRLLVTWRIEEDGCDYFGPFPSRRAAEETLQLVHQLFPLRRCLLEIHPDPRSRPCLDWYIGRCGAPCAAKMDETQYHHLVERVCAFLGGEQETTYQTLLAERQNACERLEFERARKIQNRIEALERYRARNRYQVNAVRNSHLVVVCPSSEEGFSEVFFVRGGVLRRQARFSAETPEDELRRLFAEVFLAPEVKSPLSPYDVDCMNILSQWLYSHRHRNEILALDELTPERCADVLAQLKFRLRVLRPLFLQESFAHGEVA